MILASPRCGEPIEGWRKFRAFDLVMHSVNQMIIFLPCFLRAAVKSVFPKGGFRGIMINLSIILPGPRPRAVLRTPLETLPQHQEEYQAHTHVQRQGEPAQQFEPRLIPVGFPFNKLLVEHRQDQ